MELIERYLQAVKFALPQAQQDDIIKELRDNILSQVEDKEAELGRPLAGSEQVELLKKINRNNILLNSSAILDQKLIDIIYEAALNGHLKVIKLLMSNLAIYSWCPEYVCLSIIIHRTSKNK